MNSSDLQSLLRHYSLSEAYFLYQGLGQHLLQFHGSEEPPLIFTSEEQDVASKAHTLFKTMQTLFFQGLQEKKPASDLVGNILARMIDCPADQPLSIEHKKLFFQKPELQYLFNHYFTDYDRSDLMNLVTLQGLYAPCPWESFDRLDHALRLQSQGAPGQSMESFPCLDLDDLSQIMNEKAAPLIARFGLQNIVIHGHNTEEGILLLLNNLEQGLSSLALMTGLPESSIGMSKLTFHLNAPLNVGTGAFNPQNHSISLVASSGWSALAHEWFHAVDMITLEHIQSSSDHPLHERFKKVSESISSLEKETAIGPSESLNFNPLESLQNFNIENMESVAVSVMKQLRTQTTHDSSTLSDLVNEENSITIDRIMNGLFDSLYLPRIQENQQESARQTFLILIENHLKESSQNLPSLQEKLQHFTQTYLSHLPHFHYNAFVLAEFTCRQDRLSQSQASHQLLETPSCFQLFAQTADPLLGSDWIGYSTSSLEMSARGFEGNCFHDLPPEKLQFLTRPPNQSMYWPVGEESGKARLHYLSFLHHCMGILSQSPSFQTDPEVLAEHRIRLLQSLQSSTPSKQESFMIESRTSQPPSSLDCFDPEVSLLNIQQKIHSKNNTGAFTKISNLKHKH